MGTIPQELVSFKSQVGPNLGSMNTACTSLSDKVSSVISANDIAKSGIDNYYNSSNKQTILGKFSSLNSLFSKISNSLGSDLKAILSGCQDLINKIEELENINQDISNLEATISSEESKAIGKQNSSVISNARSNISDLEKDFTTKSDEAIALLNKLKSMDGDMSFVSEFDVADYTTLLSELKGGTFEERTYKASNGLTVKYYIYIPDYGQDVSGLPVNLYLHGLGQSGNAVLTSSLPEMIDHGKVTPSGIVICPQSVSNTKTRFNDPDFQEALIELTTKVVEDYNADANRVSISGYSMGAKVGYKMIANHPGYFSAFVPVSGESTYSDALQDVKVWAFHSENDETVKYSNGYDVVNKLQSVGADATLYTFDRGGHDIDNDVFGGTFDSPSGDKLSPLEWAFRQTRSTA